MEIVLYILDANIMDILLFIRCEHKWIYYIY